MPLDAASVWTTFRTKGLRWAAVSVVSAIALGVIDQFTGRVVPYVAGQIDEFFHPPHFVMYFTRPPILNSNGKIDIISLHLTMIDRYGEPITAVTTTAVDDRLVVVRSGPGNYLLRVSRKHDGATQELVASKAIEKNGDRWEVDASDNNWADARALQRGGDGPPPTASVLVGPKEAELQETRWTTANPDFSALGSITDPTSRRLLSAALQEVGVYENGNEGDKRRILSFWAAAGDPWPTTVSVNTLNQYPWGGAFMAWIVRQAGLEPPPMPAQYASWRQWGEEIPANEAGPGLVAIFQMKSLPEAPSRLLVGVILRRRADCFEVITGNVADRVVITCVTAPLSTVRRRELG